MDNETFLFEAWDLVSEIDESSWTANQRVFATIWQLEAEVNNGGFSQYFFNSDGAQALEAPNALTAIGAVRCAAITSKAIEALQVGELNWQDEDVRQAYLLVLPEEVEDRLSALDQAFYDYPDNLSDLLAAFARSHITEFQRGPA